MVDVPTECERGAKGVIVGAMLHRRKTCHTSNRCLQVWSLNQSLITKGQKPVYCIQLILQYSVEKLNDFGFWFMYGAAQYPVPSAQCSVLSAQCSVLHAPCSVLCTLYLYSTQTHSLGTQYLSALIHAAQFDNASSKGLPQNHF